MSVRDQKDLFTEREVIDLCSEEPIKSRFAEMEVIDLCSEEPVESISTTFECLPLPAEIRLRIYGYTLPSGKIYSLRPIKRQHGTGEPHLIRHDMALFLVSRHLNQEANYVFYRQNAFRLSSRDRAELVRLHRCGKMSYLREIYLNINTIGIPAKLVSVPDDSVTRFLPAMTMLQSLRLYHLEQLWNTSPNKELCSFVKTVLPILPNLDELAIKMYTAHSNLDGVLLDLLNESTQLMDSNCLWFTPYAQIEGIVALFLFEKRLRNIVVIGGQYRPVQDAMDDQSKNRQKQRMKEMFRR